VDEEGVYDKGAAGVVECADGGPDEGFGDVHNGRCQSLKLESSVVSSESGIEVGERAKGGQPGCEGA
jgi:hypothetical protein